MKVEGLSRKRNYSGRWEELIRQCTECFNQILDLAARRRRNYILDQTNVYPTARGRKMKPFSGFQCKAVVVVPNDCEFKRRMAAREAAEGKEVPDAAVINMKANFVLPEIEETFFSSVLYTEMPPSETQMIIQMYNAEAVGLGQKATAGVVSFRSRNEQQRAEQGKPVPGVFYKDEVPTPVVTASEPLPLPAPCASTVQKETTAGARAVERRPSVELIPPSSNKAEQGGRRGSRRSPSVDSFGRRKRSRSASIDKDKKRRSRSRSKERRRNRERNNADTRDLLEVVREERSRRGLPVKSGSRERGDSRKRSRSPRSAGRSPRGTRWGMGGGGQPSPWIAGNNPGGSNSRTGNNFNSNQMNSMDRNFQENNFGQNMDGGQNFNQNNLNNIGQNLNQNMNMGGNFDQNQGQNFGPESNFDQNQTLGGGENFGGNRMGLAGPGNMERFNEPFNAGNQNVGPGFPERREFESRMDGGSQQRMLVSAGSSNIGMAEGDDWRMQGQGFVHQTNFNTQNRDLFSSSGGGERKALLGTPPAGIPDRGRGTPPAGRPDRGRGSPPTGRPDRGRGSPPTGRPDRGRDSPQHRAGRDEGEGRGSERGRGRGEAEGRSRLSPRQRGVSPPGRGPPPRPLRDSRPGDWPCNGCGNTNFAWRDACNRCKAPKPRDDDRERDGRQDERKDRGDRDECERRDRDRSQNARSDRERGRMLEDERRGEDIRRNRDVSEGRRGGSEAGRGGDFPNSGTGPDPNPLSLLKNRNQILQQQAISGHGSKPRDPLVSIQPGERDDRTEKNDFSNNPHHPQPSRFGDNSSRYPEGPDRMLDQGFGDQRRAEREFTMSRPPPVFPSQPGSGFDHPDISRSQLIPNNSAGFPLNPESIRSPSKSNMNFPNYGSASRSSSGFEDGEMFQRREQFEADGPQANNFPSLPNARRMNEEPIKELSGGQRGNFRPDQINQINQQMASSRFEHENNSGHSMNNFGNTDQRNYSQEDFSRREDARMRGPNYVEARPSQNLAGGRDSGQQLQHMSGRMRNQDYDSREDANQGRRPAFGTQEPGDRPGPGQDGRHGQVPGRLEPGVRPGPGMQGPRPVQGMMEPGFRPSPGMQGPRPSQGMIEAGIRPGPGMQGPKPVQGMMEPGGRSAPGMQGLGGRPVPGLMEPGGRTGQSGRPWQPQQSDTTAGFGYGGMDEYDGSGATRSVETFRPRQQPDVQPGGEHRSRGGGYGGGSFRSGGYDEGAVTGGQSTSQPPSQTRWGKPQTGGREANVERKLENKNLGGGRGSRWGEETGGRQGGSAEKIVKSIGDRRMERLNDKALIKNPFDPSNKDRASK